MICARLRAQDPSKHGRRSGNVSRRHIVATQFSDACSVLEADGRAAVGKKWWRSGLKSVHVNGCDIT
jgi:hypothetical protein